MLISKSFIVICCLYTMVKKVEHQHMAKHNESPNVQLMDADSEVTTTV